MKRLVEVLFVTLALAFSCQRPQLDSSEPEQATQAEATAEPAVQQVNMYLEDALAEDLEASLAAGTMATKAEGFNTVIEQMDVVSMERLFPDAGEFEARHRAAGLHKWYVVKYKGEMPATKAATTLADVPGVQVVEQPRRFKQLATGFFNDPYYSYQWGYYNDGSRSKYVEGADVDALPVWNNITTGDPNVVVGVVDAGVDFSHEDLKAHVDLANSWNFVNNSANIEAGSHGTHVGGTISAINNNGIGVSSIAGGDAAAGKQGTTLISCQVFSADGKSGKGHSAAIVWAADHGAVIANNSWGYDFTDEKGNYLADVAKEDFEFFIQPNEGEYKHSVKDAIDYFNTYAGMDANGKQVGPMAGGVCVFSAGNDANQYGVPACYPGAFSVAAIGPDGTPAYYSCYGDWVDVAAPGGSYKFGEAGAILSTLPGGYYGYMEGTSMAAPHASGVAALLVAALGGEGFTRDMLVEKMTKGTSTRVDLSGYKVGQLIDAWNAVNYGDTNPPDKVTTLSVTSQSNNLTATWKVTGHDDIPAAGFYLLYGDNKENLEAATPSSKPEGVYNVVYPVSSEKIGSTVTVEINNLEFETEYFVKVYAYSGSMVYSEASSTVSATTEKNNPPKITTDTDISNIRLKASQTLSVFFQIEDPDGHAFNVNHTAASAAESWRANPDGTYTLQITATKADPGTYKSTVEVVDVYGASTSADVNYTILENHAPVLKKSFDNVILTQVGESFNYNLSDYFSDEDEDVLTYSATNTSASSVHVAANSGKLVGTAITSGLATITVTAKDPLGKSVSAEFKVAVRTSGIPVTTSVNTTTNEISITNDESQPVSMEVKIYSATGALVYGETLSGSAFEPATVDLSNLAPGLYSVVVTYKGTDYKQTVVKK